MINKNITKKCKCGCGTDIFTFDKKSRERFYANYHAVRDKNIKYKIGAKKGSIPWNKNTKGLTTAWNKDKGTVKKDNCTDCNKRLKSYYSIRCKACAGRKNMSDPQKKERLGLFSKKNKGIPRTLEEKKKISEGRKGKTLGSNHHKWISDRSKLKDSRKDRGGQLHREWSKSVKQRDGKKCMISDNNCLGMLEAHHILGWTNYPELRYELNNGITLCHFHHPRKRKEENESIPYFINLINKLN
jgi:hypothetical protein